MKHYVCVECKNVSKNPGVCATDDCPREGAPLMACFCTDGRHEAVLGDTESNGESVHRPIAKKIADIEDDKEGDEGGTASAASAASAAEWKNDDVTEDENADDGRVNGPAKTLDLDKGDDAIEE